MRSLQNFSFSFFAYTFLIASAWASDEASLEQMIANYKPAGSASHQEAVAKCQRLSELSARRGVKALVVAFEGLISFSESAAQDLYRAHWNLSEGRAVSPSSSFGGGGHVARGLLSPLVRTHFKKAEMLVYSFDDLNNSAPVPLTCAQIWLTDRQEHPAFAQRKLVLVGHSLGGSAVLKMSKMLRERKFTVDLGVTLDPVCSGTGLFCSVDFEKGPNVRKLLNFYQHTAVPIPPNYWGSEIAGADLNLQVSSGHLNVPADIEVVRRVSAALDEVGSEQ